MNTKEYSRKRINTLAQVIIAVLIMFFSYSVGVGQPTKIGDFNPNMDGFKQKGLLSPDEASPSGDLNFSIPLLTVPGRNKHDFPIVLTYSSAITQRQYASWVGLGWNLDIGSVRRTINGRADEQTNCFNPNKYNLGAQTAGEDVRPEKDGFLSPYNMGGQLDRDRTDIIDQYSMSIDNTGAEIVPGSTSSSYYPSFRQFLAVSYKPWQIYMETVNDVDNSWFKVIKDDGSIYDFDRRDKVRVEALKYGVTQQFEFIDRWNLSKITYPDGNATNVYYTIDGSLTNREYESVVLDRSTGIFGLTSPNVFGSGIESDAERGDVMRKCTRLDSISTGTHTAVFYTTDLSTNSESVERRYRLDEIRVYDKTSGKELKRVVFLYAENPNTSGIWTANTKLKNNQQTLIALAIKNGSDEMMRYSFTYNSNNSGVNLADYETWSYDENFWGYNTGSSYSEAWRLKTITLPTGATIDYTFEALGEVRFDPEGYEAGAYAFNWNMEPRGRLLRKTITDPLATTQTWNYSYSSQISFNPPSAPQSDAYQPRAVQIAVWGGINVDKYNQYYRGCTPIHRWVQVSGPQGAWTRRYYTSSYKASDRDYRESHPDGFNTSNYAQNCGGSRTTIISSNAVQRGIVWKTETNVDTTIATYSFDMLFSISSRYTYYGSQPYCPCKDIEVQVYHVKQDSLFAFRDGKMTRKVQFYKQTPFQGTGNGLVWKIVEIDTSDRITEYVYGYQKYSSMNSKGMLSQLYSTEIYGKLSGAIGLSEYCSANAWDIFDPRRKVSFKKTWTTWNGFTFGSNTYWFLSEEWSWSDTTVTDTAPTDPDVTTSKKIMTYNEYDAYGRVLKQTDGNGYVTKFYYGTNDNPFTNTGGVYVTGIEKSLGIKQSFKYDHFGNVIQKTDENNQTITIDYDQFGRVKQVFDPSNILLGRYNYYLAGAYLSLTNPNYVYTSLYRSSTDSMRVTTYFDGAGDQTQNLVVLGDSNVVSHTTYDALKRLDKAYKPYYYYYYSGGAYSHTYDPNFSTNVANYYGTTEYANQPVNSPYTKTEYRNDGRISHQHAPGDLYQNTKYTSYDYGLSTTENFSGYPLNGELYRTTVTDENGVIRSDYTDRWGNLVSSVLDSAGLKLKTRFSYNIVGDRTKIYSPKGDLTSIRYDREGRILWKLAADADTVQYLYDKAGNLRLIKDGNHRGSQNSVNISRYMNYVQSQTGTFTLNAPANVTISLYGELYHPYDVILRVTTPDAPYTEIYKLVINQNNPYTYYPFPLSKGIYRYEVVDNYYDWGSDIWYDITCNSRKEFVYQKYDSLNRLIEVGEYENTSSTSTFSTTNAVDNTFPTTGRILDQELKYEINSPDPLAAGGQQYLKGRLSYSKAYLPGGNVLTTSYSYDAMGRIYWTILTGMGPSSKKLYSFYDWQGNVKRRLTYNIGTGQGMNYFYNYDKAGRLQYVGSGENVFIPQANEALYTYFPNGRMKRRALGNTAQGVDYRYHSRDWLTMINNQNLSPSTEDVQGGFSVDKFGEVLGYDVQDHIGYYQNSINQFTGNVSWLMYNIYGLTFQEPGYNPTALVGNTYEYDAVNRLTKSDFGFYAYPPGGWYATTAYDDRNYTYDANGNITALARYGSDRYIMDNLTYNYYTGTNKLNYITDPVSAGSYATDIDNQSASNYTYDANGNMTRDAQSNLRYVLYNIHNLPTMLCYQNGTSVWMMYNANGSRIFKRDQNNYAKYYYNGADGKTKAYQGTSDLWMTYITEGAEVDGYIKRINTSLSRYYYVKDHVGSIRVTVASAGDIVAYNDYYPFGMLMEGRNGANGAWDASYKFTGKERDVETNYDYFGARYYDARIGRWLSKDPLAEKFPSWNPYNYSYDNPICFFDPNGLWTDPINKPTYRGWYGDGKSRHWAPSKSKFGENVRGGGTQNHQGVDLTAKSGTDIKAVESGKIVFVGNRGDFGTTITLRFKDQNGDTKYAQYNHLDKTSVQTGDIVKEGASLGTTGATGNAESLPEDQRHLHFGISIVAAPEKGVKDYENPEGYMKIGEPEKPAGQKKENKKEK
jgi:RHS repeat-associated protein